MDATFRVVLRIRDDGADRGVRLLEILESLADFSERFELLVIDEAASEQAEEAGRGLAREYPQLRYVRSGSERAGRGWAVCHAGHLPLRDSHLRRLWQAHQAGRSARAR